MNERSRRPGTPIENLAIGKVIEVDGTRIIAELASKLTELSRVYEGDVYPIGQFGSIVCVHFGKRIIYASVSRLRMKADFELERGIQTSTSVDQRVIEADLFGEAEWKFNQANSTFELEFERGVATYPLPQQTVFLTPKSELRFIYGQKGNFEVAIGEHVGSGGAICYADFNEMLSKHTAILGSTGAGKSGTVAAIVHSILSAKPSNTCNGTWNPQIVILDPHNEYANAFPGCNNFSTDHENLRLPYWLLNLDEMTNLLIGKAEFVATSQTNIIKNALLEVRKQFACDLKLSSNDLTVDSPIPFPLGDPSKSFDLDKRPDTAYDDRSFVGAIDRQRPEKGGKTGHESYNSVVRKLDTLVKDKRLSFMMKSWTGPEDQIKDMLATLISQDASPIVVDLSGVPNEIAGIASAVIVRTLFSLKVWQSPSERRSSPVLLVCEEAHRYIPNSGEAQYEAAQNAIQRVAKEGRKYGIGLFIVSQRPSEVDATVLSQCNSWIVLRTANEVDRDHVRGILPDSMSGMTKMLSGLRRREAIFVGLGATLPSRIMIRNLSKDELPSSGDVDFYEGWQNEPLSDLQLQTVAERWRYQQSVRVSEDTNRLLKNAAG